MKEIEVILEDIILEDIYYEGFIDNMKGFLSKSVASLFPGFNLKEILKKININDIKKIDPTYKNIQDPKLKTKRLFNLIQYIVFISNGFIVSKNLESEMINREIYDEKGKLNFPEFMKLIFSALLPAIKKELKPSSIEKKPKSSKLEESYYYQENTNKITKETEIIEDPQNKSIKVKVTNYKNSKGQIVYRRFHRKDEMYIDQLVNKMSEASGTGFIEVKSKIVKVLGSLALLFLFVVVSHIGEASSVMANPAKFAEAEYQKMLKNNTNQMAKTNKKKSDFSKIIIDAIDGGDDDKNEQLKTKQKHLSSTEESLKALNDMKTDVQKQLEDTEGSIWGKLGFQNKKIESYKQSIKMIDDAINDYFKVTQETIKKQMSDLETKIKESAAKRVSYVTDFQTLMDSDDSEMIQQEVDETLKVIAQKNITKSADNLKEIIKEKQELKDKTFTNLDYKIFDDVIKKNPDFQKLDKSIKGEILTKYLEDNQGQSEYVKKTFEGIKALDDEIKKLSDSAEKIINKDITPEDLEIAKEVFVVENLKLIEKNISKNQQVGDSYEINYEVDDNGEVKIEKNPDFEKLKKDYDSYKQNKELKEKFNHFMTKLKIDKTDLKDTIDKINQLYDELEELEKNPEKNSQEINKIKEKIQKLSNDKSMTADEILKHLDQLYDDFSDYKDVSLIDAIKIFKIMDLDDSIQTNVDNEITKKVDNDINKKADNKNNDQNNKKLDEKTSKKSDESNKKTNQQKDNSFEKKAMQELGIDNPNEFKSFTNINILNVFTGDWSPTDYQDFIKTLKDNGIKISVLEKVMDDEVKSEINGANLWTKNSEGKWEIKKDSGEAFKKLIDKKIKEKNNQKTDEVKKENADKKEQEVKKKTSEESKKEIKDKLQINDPQEYDSLVKTLKNVYKIDKNKPLKIDWSIENLKDFVNSLNTKGIKILDLYEVSNDATVQESIKNDIWKTDDDGKTWKVDSEKLSGIKKIVDDKIKEKAEKKKQTSPEKSDQEDKRIPLNKASDMAKKIEVDANEFKSLQKIAKSFTEKNWTIGEYKDFVKSLKNNNISLSDVADNMSDNIIKNFVNDDIWKADGETKKGETKWKVDDNKIKDFKKAIDAKKISKEIDKKYELREPIVTKILKLDPENKKKIKNDIENYKKSKKISEDKPIYGPNDQKKQALEKEKAINDMITLKQKITDKLGTDSSQFDDLINYTNAYLFESKNNKQKDLYVILEQNYFK